MNHLLILLFLLLIFSCTNHENKPPATSTNVESPKSTKYEFDYNKMFNKWDTNQDNIITLKEYQAKLKKDSTRESFDEISAFNKLDLDKNGEITRPEHQKANDKIWDEYYQNKETR